MDPKHRGTVNVLSVIAYVAVAVTLHEYVMVRVLGIIVIAAIQIALSVVLIIRQKGNRQAQRMEFSMICVCISVAVYAIYTIVAAGL